MLTGEVANKLLKRTKRLHEVCELAFWLAPLWCILIIFFEFSQTVLSSSVVLAIGLGGLALGLWITLWLKQRYQFRRFLGSSWEVVGLYRREHGKLKLLCTFSMAVACPRQDVELISLYGSYEVRCYYEFTVDQYPAKAQIKLRYVLTDEKKEYESLVTSPELATEEMNNRLDGLNRHAAEVLKTFGTSNYESLERFEASLKTFVMEKKSALSLGNWQCQSVEAFLEYAGKVTIAL